ncbi:MAG TPA: glycosyltransferase [Candidatus Nanopelagicales bacterium]|nr:glycosyltransferase [Candidatus Nanopelagicales bacterium]
MRLLVATTANDGHFGPLQPFARACQAAGHEVRVAAPASYALRVASAGFRHEPLADAEPGVVDAVMARLPTLSFEDANSSVIRDVFATIDAQAALPALAATVRAWRPDLVLRESAELGSLAAAEQAGVPHAQVAIGMQEIIRLFADLTAGPMAELDGRAGLPDGTLSAGLAGEPMLSLIPEGLDRGGDLEYRDGIAVSRYRDDDPPPERTSPPPVPAWGDPEQPLVYVTFGSVTGSIPTFAGVFREALEALADQPVRVLMTVGRHTDREALGPIPGNAHVESWLPQAAILRSASALVGHGGFGTTMGALRAGLPQVVAPIFTSDQVVNSRHVAACGAGIAAEPGPGVVSRGCAELGRLLDGPSYAAGARAVAGEIAALPPISAALPVLERLAG